MEKEILNPVFPVLVPFEDQWGNPSGSQYMGLSKRELFAAMAMQSLVTTINTKMYTDFGSVGECAVKCADALIEQLNNEEE